MWGFGKKSKYRVFLETPTEQIFAQFIKIKGWYAGETPLQKLFIEEVEIESFEETERADIQKKFPDLTFITGFSLTLDTSEMSGKTSLSIRAVSTTNESIDFTKKLTPSHSWKLKQEKMVRIEPLLLLDHPHEHHPLCYDFLKEEQQKKGGIITSTAVSSHSYTEEMITAIRKIPDDHWILDCGAGYRETVYANVVHFEIEPYVSTDVRGICEELPFKDNSFDLIFSLVVLEHIKDPFTAVREMERVLKPGGKIWVDVAFMQPFHGYPNHFFNMTREGLKSLFSEKMGIVWEKVPEYGTPIWSLTWFLQRYAQGLPPSVRKTFEQLKVSDLFTKPDTLSEKNWVTELSEESRIEMAATQSILVQKKEPNI